MSRDTVYYENSDIPSLAGLGAGAAGGVGLSMYLKSRAVKNLKDMLKNKSSVPRKKASSVVSNGIYRTKFPKSFHTAYGLAGAGLGWDLLRKRKGLTDYELKDDAATSATLYGIGGAMGGGLYAGKHATSNVLAGGEKKIPRFIAKHPMLGLAGAAAIGGAAAAGAGYGLNRLIDKRINDE